MAAAVVIWSLKPPSYRSLLLRLSKPDQSALLSFTTRSFEINKMWVPPPPSQMCPKHRSCLEGRYRISLRLCVPNFSSRYFGDVPLMFLLETDSDGTSEGRGRSVGSVSKPFHLGNVAAWSRDSCAAPIDRIYCPLISI